MATKKASLINNQSDFTGRSLTSERPEDTETFGVFKRRPNKTQALNSPDAHASPPEQHARHLPLDLAVSFMNSFKDSVRIPNADKPSTRSYTTRMARNYRELTDHISYRRELFDKTCATISKICRQIDERRNPESEGVMAESLEDGLIDLVFSSNNIERAGLNLAETTKIMRSLFRGGDIRAGEISEGTSEYAAAIDSLISTNIFSLRGQHTKALAYITSEIVIKSQPLTENLIKEPHKILIHKILMMGIDRPDTDHGYGTTSWRKYAGIYRTIPIQSGTTSFVVPKHIEPKMKQMIQKYNDNIKKAEETLEIEPVHLAAKYSNMFVLIQPFLDGNGRTCRLILNALLLKYTGTVVAFGENDVSRNDYFDIVRRAEEDLKDEKLEFAGHVLGKAALRSEALEDKLVTVNTVDHAQSGG